MSSDGLPIRTERLLLRRFEPSDIAGILALSGDADVRAAAPELGVNEAEAAAYVRAQQAITSWQPDALFDLAIERIEDGQLVGMLTLVRRARHGELGYALHASARGHGLATEAARALVRHAVGALGLDGVIIETAVRNRGARGIATRLGARLVAQYDDQGIPSVRYELTG